MFADGLLGEVEEFASLELALGAVECEGKRGAVQSLVSRLQTAVDACYGTAPIQAGATVPTTALAVSAARLAVPETAGKVDPLDWLPEDQKAVFADLAQAEVAEKLLATGMAALIPEDDFPRDQACHEAILRKHGVLDPQQTLVYGDFVPASDLWQGVYLDDLLVTKRVTLSDPIPLDGTFELPAAQVDDEDIEIIARAEVAYEEAGLQRATHKAFRAQTAFKAWGGELDGNRGRVGAPLAIRREVWTLIRCIVSSGWATKAILQQVLGFVAFACQFRRELFCLQHRIYKYVSEMPATRWVRLPAYVIDELRSISLHLPFAVWKMRRSEIKGAPVRLDRSDAFNFGMPEPQETSQFASLVSEEALGSELVPEVVLGNLWWEVALTLAEKITEAGGYFFIEQPRASRAWTVDKWLERAVDLSHQQGSCTTLHGSSPLRQLAPQRLLGLRWMEAEVPHRVKDAGGPGLGRGTPRLADANPASEQAAAAAAESVMVAAQSAARELGAEAVEGGLSAAELLENPGSRASVARWRAGDPRAAGSRRLWPEYCSPYRNGVGVEFEPGFLVTLLRSVLAQCSRDGPPCSRRTVVLLVLILLFPKVASLIVALMIRFLCRALVGLIATLIREVGGQAMLAAADAEQQLVDFLYVQLGWGPGTPLFTAEPPVSPPPAPTPAQTRPVDLLIVLMLGLNLRQQPL
ncbi:unnamed protein product, partial [Symbiodinium microadriaticum]